MRVVGATVSVPGSWFGARVGEWRRFRSGLAGGFAAPRICAKSNLVGRLCLHAGFGAGGSAASSSGLVGPYAVGAGSICPRGDSAPPAQCVRQHCMPHALCGQVAQAPPALGIPGAGSLASACVVLYACGHRRAGAGRTRRMRPARVWSTGGLHTAWAWRTALCPVVVLSAGGAVQTDGPRRWSAPNGSR